MKRYALPALACLLTACSNSSSNGGGTPPPFGGNPGGGKQQSPVGGVGFTAHAWCNSYNDDEDRQDVQDRLMFNEGGNLNYEKYAWSGKRGQLLAQADGTWALNGTVLQVVLNGQRMVFQINYKNPDPQTGAERVHVYMNGQDVAYDPCH